MQDFRCCGIRDPVVACAAGESIRRHLMQRSEQFFDEYLGSGGLLGSVWSRRDASQADQCIGFAALSPSEVDGKVGHRAVGVPNGTLVADDVGEPLGSTAECGGELLGRHRNQIVGIIGDAVFPSQPNGCLQPGLRARPAHHRIKLLLGGPGAHRAETARLSVGRLLVTSGLGLRL